jgi:hypothetical protein
MKFRKLRIAWSVVWTIAAVLLVALWVRSYWRADSLGGQVSRTHSFEINSRCGVVGLTFYGPEGPYDPNADMGGVLDPTNSYLILPYWFLVALSASFLVAPWLRWPNRFSLRAMLIATTLLAVVLGLICYAAR